jgi:hypothetical protein
MWILWIFLLVGSLGLKEETAGYLNYFGWFIFTISLIMLIRELLNYENRKEDERTDFKGKRR